MERIQILSRHVSRQLSMAKCAAQGKPAKLFVANRGEIALRIFRAAADLGIPTVACVVEADADALHARSADEMVSVPSYLDGEALVAAALEKGCNLVHPGYGYLSESAEFGLQCVAAGITFVGPTPETLALFGDKTSARRFAKQHGVPVAGGSDAPCASVAEMRQAMQDQGIGFPVMLKAAGGGGGRGMRPVANNEELEEAFETCAREAGAAFGKSDVFVEELLTKARHIEVQVLGDGRGGCVHLYERDCSVQRRRQKVIESSPARGLEPRIRELLLENALKLVRACSYRGAGTVEFLVSGSKIAFIEANARIQVEHTVTEEACGVDLVRAQLLIAQGMTLAEIGFTQDEIVLRGYAIQARIILTRIGAIGSYSEPGGKDVRVDSCCFPGMVASSQFDPMVAKLIVRGPLKDPLAADGDGFDAVRRRLVRACGEFHIGGSVQTNIAELQRLLNLPEYKENQWTTVMLDERDKAPTSAAELNVHGANRDRAKLLDDAFGAGHNGKLAAKAKTGSASVQQRETPSGCVWVKSPVQGQVVAGAKESVKVGDVVRAGGPVLVLNAMKMEFLVTSPTAGTVVEVGAMPDQQVEEGEQVVLLREAGTTGDSVVDAVLSEEDRFAIRPSLQRLFDRQHMTSDTGRIENDKVFAKRIAERHKRGQQSARENVGNIVDPGTFIEYGQLTVAGQRRRRTLDDLMLHTPADGMIAGIGMVNSAYFPPERARCGVMAYDYTVLAGTQGLFNHEKVDRLVEVCAREALPIIWFCEGGGGRPGDTDGHGAAGLTVPSFMNFGRLSGLVPLVGLTSGYCFAGNAAFLGVCDVVIATKGSNLGLGGPAMIEGGGLGVFAPTEIGPIDESFALGCVDLLVDDEAAAAKAATRYLSYFQGTLPKPPGGFKCTDQREVRNVVPENRLRVYEMRDAIELLVDNGSFMELRAGFGIGMITGLARFEGQAVGILANDPKHIGGAIDADAAMKAARFLELYDAFDLPIVVLCDCPGFMVGPDSEREGAVRKVCRMFAVGGSITVPLVTIVTRKAYGLGAQAMAGGMMMGPNSFCVAWPTGEFGGMGLEGAVKLGFSKELAAAAKEGPAAHKELYDKLVGDAYNRGQATNVATGFEIDQVIDPADTRRMIVQLMAAHPPSAQRRRTKKRPCVSTY